MFNGSKQKAFRQKLRGNPTYPEFVFWQAIRGKSLGVKFRRQQDIGGYIVDFYAAEIRLVIEIDGDSHFTAEGISADEERTFFLKGLGMTVLRFTNLQVCQDLSSVLEYLRIHIGNLRQ